MSVARAVPSTVSAIARRLDELFGRDQELAIALNAAQDRLFRAKDQLTAGLSADAPRAVYGPPGADLELSGRKPAVLEDEQPIAALERVGEAIRRAFSDYQHTAEDRRVHASDVGEAIAQLVAAMGEAGFTEDEARGADVQALTAGIYRPDRERSG